jgi:predicted dehydrogenase
LTIRVGFLGAGFISAAHTWQLAKTTVDHRIVAVSDPDAARAKSMAETHDAVACGEDELLDRVDAVFITSWTAAHEELVDKAAAAGVAIFCEKPLGFDATAAQRMAQSVERASVINQVGLVLRTSPAFAVVRQLLSDPRAGKTLAVVFRDDQFIPNQGHYASQWRVDPELAGRGTLLEHSIHDVDMLQWMFGPVAAASAVTREHHGYRGIDDLAVARLEFDSGPVVQLTSVWHDILERGSLRHVEVFCDNLYVKLEGDRTGPVRWQFTGEAEQAVERRGTINFLNEAGVLPVSLEQNFLEAVRDGNAASPLFRDALPAHQIVDALYASADAGGTNITAVYPTA